MSQRCALPQHSCKTLYPGLSNVIVAETEMSQRWALRQHFSETLCILCFDTAGMIEFIIREVII